MTIKKITTQIKKMRTNDWLDLLKLTISFVPGKILKLFSKEIWVIGEYSTLARDNGYWTFKYIRENHPSRKVYYPINKNCSDYKRMVALGNTVKFDGFIHCMLFWACTAYVQTAQSGAFPCRRITEDLVNWGFNSFKNILLNHGFTRGYSSMLDPTITNYDAIFTCSLKDAQIIVEDNNNDKKIIRNVGYSRHDSLCNDLTNSKQILIMPTWRKWIDYRLLSRESDIKKNEKDFLSSPYYLRFQSLITNKKLQGFLSDNNIKVIFYLHEYAQEYSRFYISDSPNVVIGKNNRYTIQELLNKSCLLITDYSSVCYDFAYMKKPVLYYQFDLEEFEKKQYAQGDNFSYEKDGFGEVFYDEKKLVEEIIRLYKMGFSMEKVYCDRVESFFSYQDNNNCKRVYEEIVNITG